MLLPMSDLEVYIDLDGRAKRVGLGRSSRVRGDESIGFEYQDAWRPWPGSTHPTATWSRLLASQS